MYKTIYKVIRRWLQSLNILHSFFSPVAEWWSSHYGGMAVSLWVLEIVQKDVESLSRGRSWDAHTWHEVDVGGRRHLFEIMPCDRQQGHTFWVKIRKFGTSIPQWDYFYVMNTQYIDNKTVVSFFSKAADDAWERPITVTRSLGTIFRQLAQGTHAFCENPTPVSGSFSERYPWGLQEVNFRNAFA